MADDHHSPGENPRRDTDRHIDLEELDPPSLDEALSIIGDETRAAIIMELGSVRSVGPGESNALAFTELCERVGVDDSGLFNYHLDKLVGTFVKKREDGYTLRLPGQLLYQSFVAGTLTDRHAVTPFPVGDCPRCDGQLSGAYHPDHLLTVECTDCETLFDAIHFPANGIEDRSKDEILDAAYQNRHHKVATMRRGTCPSCGGVVDRDLQSSASITYGSGSVEEMAGLDTYATLECRDCKRSLVGHPANVAVTTPTVVAFFADHDRDVALSHWWDDPIAASRDSIEVVEEGPYSVGIPFEIDGERLRIVVDDEIQVVEAERHRV